MGSPRWVARSLQPSVILMDVGLPGLNGWQATRQLKADDRTKHIPIIIVTGHAVPRGADTRRAAGYDRVMMKPCLPDEVLAMIQQVLSRDGLSV